MIKFLGDGAVIILFAALTALGGLIKLPFLPNHVVTLQIFFPLLAGAFLGRDRGALSQIIFLVIGILAIPYYNIIAVGMPAPAMGTSPTFARVGLKVGYLLGYVAAAYLIGTVFEEKKIKELIPIIITMLGGLVLIYLTGLLIFMVVFRFDLSILFYRWSLPFVAFDSLKAILAGIIYWRANLIFRPFQGELQK